MNVQVELKESCGTNVSENENPLSEGNSLVEELLNSVQINGDAEDATGDDIVDMFLLAEKSEFTVVDETIGSPKNSNGVFEVETETDSKTEPMEESNAKESGEKLQSNECETGSKMEPMEEGTAKESSEKLQSNDCETESKMESMKESTVRESNEKLQSNESETECNVSEEDETMLLMSPQRNLSGEKNNEKDDETELAVSPQSDPLCDENNIESEEMSPQNDPLAEENDVEAEETQNCADNDPGETVTAEGEKKSNGETDLSADISDLQVDASRVGQSDDNESWHSADNQPGVSSKQFETTTEKDLEVSNQEAGDAENEASVHEPEIQIEQPESAENVPKTRKRKRKQSLPKEDSAPVHVLRKRKIKTEVVEDAMNQVYIKEEKCDEEMLPEEVGTAAMFVKSEGSQSRSKPPKPTPQKRQLRSRSSPEKPKKQPINPNLVNCKICGRFSRIENIEAHMRIHTNEDGTLKPKPTEQEGPLMCQLCAREFVMIKSLRNHMRVKHNCTEIIRCIKCDFITTNLTEFRKHVKSHDSKANDKSSDPKLLGCDVCDFKTLLRKVLRHHVEGKHGKLHKCNRCSKVFTFNDEVEVHKTQFHVKTKYRCRRCKRYFRNSDNLSRHEKACK